jgi:hypothetical protein
MSTRIKKKVISIQEFKAWLEGVEEMQGSTWIPDAKQWKRIRQKINQIHETIDSQQQYSSLPTTNMSGVGENIVIPKIPSSFERSRISNLPPTPSSTIIPAHNSLQRNLSPDGSEKVKTPDIDTSKSEYVSSFE